MKSLATRLTLLVVFLLAAGGTAYLIWNDEATLRAQGDAARAFDDRATAIARGVMDLRAAQQAYVAAGQGEDFWTEKVSAAVAELGAAIAVLRGTAVSSRAQSAFEAAGAVLQDFERMDRRARYYASSGQELLASDLIFSDGLEMTAAALASVDEGRAAEQQARAEAVRAARRTELAALGLTAALGLLVIALLIPIGRDEAQRSQATSMRLSEATGATETLGDDFEFAPVLSKFTRPDTPPAPSATAPEPVDLSLVASLCGDLARIVDTRALPSILERASTILGATGVVLWIADPDGHELTPIAAHGYPPQLVTRLGNLKREAPNVTAAAFRTGLVQTVRADAVSSGAIAAPLVSAAGAVGVMAAEVRDDGERQPPKLAAAAIIAAQLATLVGPPVSRSHSKAGAAGA